MTTNEKNETTDQTFGGKLEGHYERLWRDECEAGAEIRRQRDLALAQAQPPEKLVLSMIERIAARMGVSPKRVQVTFQVYSAEDGGPSWEIHVSRPSPDKRKLDESFRGGGTTLAEAEKNFLQGVSEKENPKPRSFDPELQALLDAARTEKVKKP